MGHFNLGSLNTETPPEARAKVKKPVGKVGDAHVRPFLMPNASPTPPHFLNSGDYNTESGQLKVRNQAIRNHLARIIVEAYRQGAADVATCTTNPRLNAGELAQRSTATLIATHADAGVLGEGYDKSAPDRGDRPRYGRQEYEEETEGFDGDEALDQAAAHISEARTEGCDKESKRDYATRAIMYLSRFLDGDSDGDKDDNDARLDDAMKTYQEKAPNASELQRDAVKISSNGSQHLGPMPQRGKTS